MPCYRQEASLRHVNANAFRSLMALPRKLKTTLPCILSDLKNGCISLLNSSRAETLGKPNVLALSGRETNTQTQPPSGPRSASTPGWTARAPIMGRLMFFYGAWSAIPTWNRAIVKAPIARPGGRSAPPSAGAGAGVEHAGARTDPAPCCRPHWSLTGSPPVSHGRALPHATCSQPGSAGGGTPARGTRAVHTSGCPQTGHHSAGASPQVSPRCAALPWWGHLHRPLAHLLPALGQRRPLGVAIQPPTAHAHGPGWRHMEEPAPNELGER